MNPYKIIEGKYPTYAELRDWSEQRWLDYIDFLDELIVIHENTEKYRITSDIIREMELHRKEENHPWAEFIWRTGQWADNTTPTKYRLKVNGMAMHVLGYLKKHPSLVTPLMKESIERHPQRMGWCLNQFKVTETLGGEEIVRRDVVVPADSIAATKQTSLPSMQAKLMTAIVKYADVTELIAQGIKPEDIKKMDIKDKLAFLHKAIPTLATLGKAKTTTSHFTQINMNGSTKEVEAQMLNFVKKKSENE